LLSLSLFLLFLVLLPPLGLLGCHASSEAVGQSRCGARAPAAVLLVVVLLLGVVVGASRELGQNDVEVMLRVCNGWKWLCGVDPKRW
jgi:hypothetical protein